jgi:hypothetical protein
MSFDLKTTFQPDAELSPQQKKLNRLIEKIEQQKIDFAAWKKAQNDIQQHARKTLVPVYNELHTVLFQQFEQLWKHLHSGDFSKAEVVQLDEKIQHLAAYLKDSKALSEQEANTVEEIDTFYKQYAEHTQTKKAKKKPFVGSNPDFETSTQNIDDEFADTDHWDSEQHQQAREQAKFKKQQEKREQAEKMAEQSLKTVYLKIAAVIHPDREQEESKKIEKTEMLQHANAAYEQQDLFYLLKLQIQIEQNRGAAQKGLSADQIRFYKLALDAQSQQLDHQIDEIIDSLVWSENAKIAVQKSKGKVQINDLYKQIDADTEAIKQQVKWEKDRLKYMSRVKGLEMLLENGAL